MFLTSFTEMVRTVLFSEYDGSPVLSVPDP